MNIKIYYTDTENLIKQKSLNALLEQIPVSLHLRANRYKSDISAYNFVVARLLLKHGLKDFGLDTGLEEIAVKENAKPYLANIQFNISHSGHKVCLAFSTTGELGLDIEEIKPVKFENFSTMFSTNEWNVIKNDQYPLRKFYWFWTRKESIIKASGLSLRHLNNIEIDVASQYILWQRKRWFLKELNLGEKYAATICTENMIKNLSIEQVDFNISYLF